MTAAAEESEGPIETAWEAPAPSEDVESAPSEEPVVPTDEPSSGEPDIPFLDMADMDELAGEGSTEVEPPAETAAAPVDTEEPAEALPEFLGPLPTVPEVAEETGAGAEEALTPSCLSRGGGVDLYRSFNAAFASLFCQRAED